MSFSLRLAFHTGVATILPNPCNGFKVCGICGFILQLVLTVCHQGYFDYLAFVPLASLTPWDPGMEPGIVFCFSVSPFIFSVLFSFPDTLL
jgi:hypothetical protein